MQRKKSTPCYKGVAEQKNKAQLAQKKPPIRRRPAAVRDTSALNNRANLVALILFAIIAALFGIIIYLLTRPPAQVSDCINNIITNQPDCLGGIQRIPGAIQEVAEPATYILIVVGFILIWFFPARRV